jgi:hypothetical protein
MGGMPRYYFHFIDNGDRSEDEAGLELVSAEAAYLEAVKGAKGMWTELLVERRNPSRCAFEIADERGVLLFRLNFAEVLESCPEPGIREAGSGAAVSQMLRATHTRVAAARSDLTESLNTARDLLKESNTLLSRLSAFERPRRL